MAEFRHIAPLQADQSSGSSSSRQGGPSGQSSGPTSQGGSGSASSESAQHRRRKISGQVNTSACTECQRAKAKCDGRNPETCSRCTARGVNCVYGLHTKVQKDDLLREIKSVRAEHRDLRDEHAGLQRATRTLQKLNDDQSIILDIITNNGHADEVVKRLRAGDTRESIAEWLDRVPELKEHIKTKSEAQQNLIAVVGRLEALYQSHAKSPVPNSSHRWTSVTNSQALIGHLFDLYFTWVHPVHMLFSEMNFLESYLRGETTYCSRVLVNAICAMACHLLESSPRSDASQDIRDRIKNVKDIVKLGEGFMVEARSFLEPSASGLPFTSVQAFAVMYLADVSSGKARSASGYLRCAAENLKVTTPHEQNALQLSEWGIHTLNTAWSGITYQKPFNPISPRMEVDFHVQLPLGPDPPEWKDYRLDPTARRRPSFAIITASCHAKLFRIVHDSINVYCGARGKVTASQVVGCYKRYLDWKESLPIDVKITALHDSPLPHILSLHIQFHTALIQLLIPLVECQYFSATDTEEIRKMIINHTRDGLNILSIFKKCYSCRCITPLTTFCVLHLSDAAIKFGGGDLIASAVLEECLEILEQNRVGFALCGPLQQMLRKTALEYHISLPSDLTDRLESLNRYGVDDILDACTRLSYAQPTEQIVRWIDPNIAGEWRAEWDKQITNNMPQPISGRPSMGDKTMQIHNLLNQ